MEAVLTSNQNTKGPNEYNIQCRDKDMIEQQKRVRNIH